MFDDVLSGDQGVTLQFAAHFSVPPKYVLNRDAS